MGGESGRTRTEADMNPWRTARGAAGRMPPNGFPRDNGSAESRRRANIGSTQFDTVRCSTN